MSIAQNDDDRATTIATRIFLKNSEGGSAGATCLILDDYQYRDIWKNTLGNVGVDIEVTNSRNVSIMVLNKLYLEYSKNKPISGVIAIIDKEFDLNFEEEKRMPNLLETDDYDFNMMLFDTVAFTKFYASYCNDSKIRRFFNITSSNAVNELKSILLNKLNGIGNINLINHQEQFGLDFSESLDFSEFVSKDNLNIDLISYIQRIAKEKSTKILESLTIFEKKLKSVNPKNLCPGDWIFSLLAFGVNSIFSERPIGNKILQEDIKYFFYAGIEPTHFKEIRLFDELKKWETKTNHQILKLISSERVDNQFLSFLIECTSDPGVATRKEGDPQLSQLATFLAGCQIPNCMRKIAILDVGAGMGDLIRAIELCGSQNKFDYYPIEPKPERRQSISKLLEKLFGPEKTTILKSIAEIEGRMFDRIFFVNTLHELDFEVRSFNLYKSLELTRKYGLIIIHEVTVLTKGEANFLMFDGEDYKIIFSKIDEKINLQLCITSSGVGGWPFQTIIIENKSDKDITFEQVKNAISSSLKEINKKWIKRNSEPSQFSQADYKDKIYRAFIIAQIAYCGIWVDKYSQQKS